MADDKNKSGKGDRSTFLTRTRKSDRIAGVLVCAVAINTWKLHNFVDGLVEAERTKTIELVNATRKYADDRFERQQKQIEKSIARIEAGQTELRGQVSAIYLAIIGSKK